MTAAPKIGLACAGGVVEGAFYEIGALCALEEAIPGLDLNRLHVYVGVSSGAIIATFLAAGVPIKALCAAVSGYAPSPQASDELDLSLGPSTLFRPDWDEFGRRLSSAPGSLIRAFSSWLDRGRGSSEALVELSSLVPVGLFDHAPIERYVARVLASRGLPNRFGAFPAELRVVAVDVDTARTVVFGSDEHRGVPVSRAVQASTALPVMYRPVEIDGRSYIDGVATRTLHASRALDAGADLVICVNPIVPVDLDGSSTASRHLAEAGLPLVLSQTFRTLVHSRLETGFRRYRHTHPGRDTLLLEPKLEEPLLFFSNIFSFANRREVCEQAYRGTRQWLLKEADTIDEVLGHHGLFLDREGLADARKTLCPGTRRTPVQGSLEDALDRLDRVLRTFD